MAGVKDCPMLPNAGTLPMPLAAWLLCESFIRWAGSWAPPSLDAAATRLEDSIVAAAARGGLGAQVREALSGERGGDSHAVPWG